MLIKSREQKIVDAFISSVAAHVDKMDTAEEVRQYSSYAFCLAVTEQVTNLGVPADLASKSVNRMKVALPPSFNKTYPEAFAQIVQLYSKMLSAIWTAVQEDYDASSTRYIFLSLCTEIVVEIDFSKSK